MKSLLLLALVGCDEKEETPPEDSGCACEPVTSVTGACIAEDEQLDATDVETAALSLDVDVFTLGTGEWLLTSAEEWAAGFPETDPATAGVDFDSQVAFVAVWGPSSTCDAVSSSLSVLSGNQEPQIYIEATFSSPDAAACAVCDMAARDLIAVALPRIDAPVSICVRTEEGCG